MRHAACHVSSGQAMIRYWEESRILLGGGLRILSTSGGPSGAKPRKATCPKERCAERANRIALKRRPQKYSTLLSVVAYHPVPQHLTYAMSHRMVWLLGLNCHHGAGGNGTRLMSSGGGRQQECISMWLRAKTTVKRF